jgi:hypothetical protein
MGRYRLLLTLTALGCFGIVILHILISFAGVEFNRFIGAPPGILKLIEEGSWLVPAMGLGIALLFTIFGLYALSGAGKLRRLPLLKSVILFLGLMLTYRGLAIIISIQNFLKNPDYSTWQYPLMSLGALCLGLATLWGVLDLRKTERRRKVASTV